METALGWTRAQTSGAFSSALLTSGLAALTAGRIVDRHGGRRTGDGLVVRRLAGGAVPGAGRHRPGAGRAAAIPGVAGAWVFAGLFALANGASTLARAGLVADTYGARNDGIISGSTTGLIALLQTVAPLAVGALRVAGDGYGAGLVMPTLFALAAAAAIERARRGTASPVLRGELRGDLPRRAEKPTTLDRDAVRPAVGRGRFEASVLLQRPR